LATRKKLQKRLEETPVHSSQSTTTETVLFGVWILFVPVPLWMQQTTLYMLFALFFAGFAPTLFFLSLTTGTVDV